MKGGETADDVDGRGPEDGRVRFGWQGGPMTERERETVAIARQGVEGGGFSDLPDY
jgi:hypothetical protein